MTTHNTQFHHRIRTIPKYLFSLAIGKKFVGTRKRVRISHGKRVIGVRAIEVRLYLYWLRGMNTTLSDLPCILYIATKMYDNRHDFDFVVLIFHYGWRRLSC